jgi:hypothetical protein
MCNLRFSTKEQDFCVKARFIIGKIASVSKKQFSVAIPRKNTNFWVGFCIQMLWNCGWRSRSYRPSVQTSRRRNLEDRSQNCQIKGTKYHFEDHWKVWPLVSDMPMNCMQKFNMRRVSAKVLPGLLNYKQQQQLNFWSAEMSVPPSFLRAWFRPVWYLFISKNK